MGLISLKKLFNEAIGSSIFDIKKNLYKPVFVPESMAAYRVLEHFKFNKLHNAIVVDEYGAVQGIITMNDVMDELIGDNPEEDSNEYQITPRNENSWLVDGQFPYFELIGYLNITDAKEAGNFTTVGGLFIHKTNHIPKAGEKIEWKNYEIEVVDMDGHRIDKIFITRM